MARRSRPASITAAASRIIDFESPRARSLAPDAESLYGLYDRLGPIHAAMQSKFLAASKITYFPARKTDPDQDPEPVDDGPAREAFDRLQGPQGEFGDFIAEMGMHWEIAGEGYLVGKSLTADEEWDVWSAVEYEKHRRGQGNVNNQDAVESLEGGDFIMRSWRSHPMLRELPDSPLRSVVDQCDQLILFQDMLSALGRSRLSAGMMLIPEGLDLPDTGDDETKKALVDFIFDAMNAAVVDSKSTSRLVPIVVEGPGDFLDQVRILEFTRELPKWVPETIEKVTRQIAIGLDLPADILTGMADVNHWSAWLIDDSLRLNYVDPLILAVLDSFTRGYLVPALREEGVVDADQFLFWRDYSDLSSRAVTAADALASFDAGIISADAARRSIGFTEADAPEEDEPNRTEGVVVEEDRGIPDTMPGMMDESEMMPAMVAAAARPSLAQIDHRVYAQISEAAQAALDRALERAGGKIRSAVLGAARDHRPASNRTFASVIDGVDNMNVAMTLGRGNVATLQLSDTDLIPEDSFDRVGTRVDKILTQGLEDTYRAVTEITGTEPQRDEAVERGFIETAVGLFTAALLGFAVTRLFTPEMTPDPAETGEVATTEIPPPIVFDTMTTASGGAPGVQNRGLANGQLTENWVVSAGFNIRERTWSVGAPARPFEPHRALSGTRFEQWTDDKLRTPVTASWLGYDYMFPGDHKGCVCLAELVIAEGETLSPVSVAA